MSKNLLRYSSLKFFSDFHRYAYAYSANFLFLGFVVFFVLLYFKCSIHPENSGTERDPIDHFYKAQAFVNVYMLEDEGNAEERRGGSSSRGSGVNDPDQDI